MSAFRLLMSATFVALTLAAPACDSGSSGLGDPLTSCAFSFSVKNAGAGDFGEACTSNSDCEYGVCLMPGAAGNLLNNQFGFCTRGCDCDNNTASRLTAVEKETLVCLYPPGNQGAQHHVVLLCDSVSDCQTAATGWSQCAIPSSGGVKAVCQAP